MAIDARPAGVVPSHWRCTAPAEGPNTSVESMAENTTTAGNRPRFRVSDAVAIPRRGMLLRLRRVAGRPEIRNFKPGRSLTLIAPDGMERVVKIMDLSETGGRQTQDRLDTIGELDLVVDIGSALADDIPVEIGWHAAGA